MRLESLVLGAVLVSSAAVAADVTTLSIGAEAPPFDLPGIDGRRHTLDEYREARVLVVVFTANHCPTAQAYEARIQALHDEYAKRGVALVAISPNDPEAVRLDELGYTDLSDSLAEMKLRARERRFTFPYLYDGETQAVSRRYGPVATPHVFVFDHERRLRFAGRIDDSENPANVKTHETRDAIEALLDGRPAPVETTKVFGCSIKWSEKRASVTEALEEWAREDVTLETVKTDALKTLKANASDKPLLVNVWATWCGPCVSEFKDLVAVYRTYRGRGLEVVTVSADSPERKGDALHFLQAQHASMRNLIPDSGDSYALVDAVDSDWPGALPYTLLLAPGGRPLYRSVGAFDGHALRKAIVEYLGRYYHSSPDAARP
ncbi:MAG TPA: redoxin domain-containing protein [Vicinamibacteria bacterium]|jgi:peroxiredoxin